MAASGAIVAVPLAAAAATNAVALPGAMLSYQLMKQILDQNQGALAFAEIPVSVAGIVQGLAAYEAVEAMALAAGLTPAPDWTLKGAPPNPELLQLETDRVLQAPLNLDTLIAVKFLADEIKKLEPPPVQAAALAAAEAAIGLAGTAAALLRHSFAGVPEPPLLCTPTVPPDVPIAPGEPAEDVTIAQQTALAVGRLITLFASPDG